MLLKLLGLRKVNYSSVQSLRCCIVEAFCRSCWRCKSGLKEELSTFYRGCLPTASPTPVHNAKHQCGMLSPFPE